MSSSASYLDHRFRQKVDNALRDVRRILDTTRNPTFAADEQADHTYDDKYKLAEFVINAGVCAHANALERLGLDADGLEKLRTLAALGDRTVSLRLEGSVECDFDCEKSVKIDSPHAHVTDIETTAGDGGDGEGGSTGGRSVFGKARKTVVQHKVVTTVKEFHWKVTTEHSIFAFAGSDPNQRETSGRVDLLGRKSTQCIVTTGDRQAPPFPPHKSYRPIDVDITWLLANLSSSDGRRESAFSIDRKPDACRTPRRNDDAKAALEFFRAFEAWSQAVKSHFVQEIGRAVLGKHAPAIKFDPKSPTVRNPLGGVNASDVFVPVLPLFEASKPAKGSSVGGDAEVVEKSAGGANLVSLALPWDVEGDQAAPLLSLGDVNLFLAEQCRGLDKKILTLKTEFPAEDAKDKLISCQEANITMLSDHMVGISQNLSNGINCIEEMLRSQLVAAIGKEIKPSDFAEFMKFHNPKLFKAEFSPQPFCFAVRRPNHYPDGVLSIEGADGEGNDGKTAPVTTILRKFDGQGMPPMRIPLNAATSVEVTGPRCLHAWVHQTFAGQPDTKSAGAFSLMARARQFSCFVLMVGKILGADKFEPEAAIILQNKDEVLIPLLLTPLPSAKEFKDAIASLSPEQQRFAKAFRNMQLESSVFGACVVQLKPQLEALLGLPADALTKEIKLTQDLLSLFIEYQIPSDLVSYDGPSDASVREKVETVKKHAQAVLDMIGNEKKKQLEEAAQVADMAVETHAAGSGFYAASAAMPMSFAPPPSLGGLVKGGGGGARMGGGAQQMRFRSAAAVRSAAPVALAAAEESMSAEYSEYEEEEAFADDLDLFDEGEGGATKPDKPATDEIKRPSDVKDDAEDPQDMTVVDFTKIPKKLDAKFESLDDDAALRPTTIKTGPTWTKKTQATLLSKLEEKRLDNSQQKTEKDKAFDLLDALSRSGSLSIACAELHVIVAVTHCFDHSLIATVIEDNVNPIEKMEKSMLMIASTIHDLAPTELLKDTTQLNRVKGHAEKLFDATSG